MSTKTALEEMFARLRETADKVEELQALTRWLSETNMDTHWNQP